MTKSHRTVILVSCGPKPVTLLRGARRGRKAQRAIDISIG